MKKNALFIGLLLVMLSSGVITLAGNTNKTFLPMVYMEPIQTSTPTTPPPTPPLNPNRTVFTSNRDGNEEIYTMNQNGLEVTRITQSSGRDWAAKWSPDWTKISFTSDRDGNNEIYIMNSDGTGITRLSNNPASDIQPDWSPDGNKIVFSSNRDGNFGIYIMNADGSAVTRVGNYLGTTPAWSPDGQRIAFTGYGENLDVVNVDGTNFRHLTQGMVDHCQGWSPDS